MRPTLSEIVRKFLRSELAQKNLRAYGGNGRIARKSGDVISSLFGVLSQDDLAPSV